MANRLGVKQTTVGTPGFRQVMGDLYASAAVTDEQVANAKKDLEALEKQAASKCVAFYKIEVQFGKNHHINGTPTYGMVTIWESGTKLHGGGDSLLYVCPGKSLGKNECESVIPDSVNGRSVVVCPHCYTSWKNVELIGQHYYRLPIQKWAEVIYRWFLRLNLNADIRVKYFYDDIRAITAKEKKHHIGGDFLERARSSDQRISRVYPLANILKDVNAGADIYNRILAFLKA